MVIFLRTLRPLVEPLVFSLAVFWFSLVVFTLFPKVGRAAQRALAHVEQWAGGGRSRH